MNPIELQEYKKYKNKLKEKHDKALKIILKQHGIQKY